MTKTENLLDNFFSRVNNRALGNLMYQTANNVYVLFDQYQITKKKSQSTVIRHSDCSEQQFSTSKVATAWCILDRYNKIYESQRVVELDKKIQSLYWEKINLSKLQKISRAEQQEIFRDKLLETISREKQFQYELDKYIIMAKQCQLRGFENELTRTSNK